MSLSSALVSDSPSTSCSPVTPPRYPTTQLKAGSSHTQVRLETFEDLLKQAGYSQTRVITPKAERLAKDAATYSSHRRDDSADTDINVKDSTLSGIAKLLSWVAGSTQADQQQRQKREFINPDTSRPKSKPKPRIPDDSIISPARTIVPSVRPPPPLRQTSSSPQLQLATASIVPKSRQNSNTKPSSAHPTRRSPLPDAWQESKSTTHGQTPRRRLPSEKLLARSGSLTSAAASAAAATVAANRKAHLSPVTVSCRSSSVGATTRKKPKDLPLLTPSTDEPGPWRPPLPKINLHSTNHPNGKRSLPRTGSAPTGKALSRNASSYISLSRREPEHHHDHEEDEEESDNEPHLANIIAPHISPLLEAPSQSPTRSAQARPGPVGRQRSIQSLRACLNRHESRGSRMPSRVASPQTATFPLDQGPAVVAPRTYDPSKRRSMGHVDTNDVTERGRSGSRGILEWPTERSPSHSAQGAMRAAAAPAARGVAPAHENGKKDKRSQKELETERLLWGTSWGRK